MPKLTRRNWQKMEVKPNITSALFEATLELNEMQERSVDREIVLPREKRGICSIADALKKVGLV